MEILALALTHSIQYKLIGFIDDSKDLQGSNIRGVSIYADNKITDLIEKFKIHEILIAIPSASLNVRRRIINKIESYPIIVRTLPSILELAKGNIGIDDLRKVNINDLLGRDPVAAEEKLLSKNITNKIVMVTGAGGSIGVELCVQIILLKPKCLILYEISEFALYKIEKKLVSINSNNISIYPILGSINNLNRLNNIMKNFNVQTIYHAAAYKHVIMVELNNIEGAKNNILGTLNCALAAIDNNVEVFVLISSDKAVRPTSTMGATKRFAELILQALATEQNTTLFTMVRFGNVLDSSGSVVPLFKDQIKKGGPVTVTDINVIRYFMTVSEAVELVIQASAMSKGGDVFVLDMGEPISIKDLAIKMINLSGFKVKD